MPCEILTATKNADSLSCLLCQCGHSLLEILCLCLSPDCLTLTLSPRLNWPISLALATLSSGLRPSCRFTWVHVGTALCLFGTINSLKETPTENLTQGFRQRNGSLDTIIIFFLSPMNIWKTKQPYLNNFGVKKK